MKILGWIVALPFVVLVLYILARFALCRPNYFTVKSATPMVEKIADYIVEHGVPERLDKIPDLPYKLEGCKKKITYLTKKRPRKIVQNKLKADYTVVNEKCFIFQNNKRFNITLYYTDELNMISGNIKIVSKNTVIGTSFEFLKGKKYKFSSIWTNYNKITGFCRQFKQ